MKKSQYVKLIICTLVAVLGIFSFVIETLLDDALINIFDNFGVAPKKDNLIVHFIDVGEGDAMAINFPNGQVALVDTGNIDTASDVMMYIDNYVINNKNDRVIDYIFITHCDSDHTGGLKRIVNNYDVKNVFRPRQYTNLESTIDYGYESSVESYVEGISAVKQKDCNLTVAVDGMQFSVGGVTIQLFSPLVQFEDSNDYSYFIKMTYKQKSILFTGDASSEVEELIMAGHYKELKSDYLKVAHHGSAYSTCANFVKCVSPKFAIISVGINRFGHPTETVLEKLENVGAQVFRTDIMGNICIDITQGLEQENQYATINICTQWGFWCVIIEFVNTLLVAKIVSKQLIGHIKSKKIKTKN